MASGVRGVVLPIVLAMLAGSVAAAQWLNYPTPGIPRTADGRPTLNAPAPRTADGKPDLSGVWQFTLGPAYSANIVADLQPSDIEPWADTLFRRRLAQLGTDDSSYVGCLPRGPRYFVGSGPVPTYVKIVQTPHLITLFYEELAYRQIFMDGRALPSDPNPSFMGYSVGRWEGDALVVDSIGFNDRTWLDFGGHPHTESLRITERFRRDSIGRMELAVTLSDRGAYRRAFTVPVSVTLAPDTELLEYVCNENESRRTAIGLSPVERATKVSAATLAQYQGTYRAEPGPGGRPSQTLTVRLRGGELYLDIDGRGNIPMVPLSNTLFSVRLLNIEFVRADDGMVTHVLNVQNGQRLARER